MIKIAKRIIVLSLLALLLFPAGLNAATLYLDPVSKTVGPNDSVELKIKIGGMGTEECINVANVSLNFSKDVLEVKDFNSGESIFSLWVEKPEKDDLDDINEEGKIVFAGGVPGGYCGNIPSESGESDILGSVIFVVKKPVIFHQADVSFSSETELFLNDGYGTSVSANTQGAHFEIDEDKVKIEDSWGEKLIEDIFPPEAFIIEINKKDNVWDGQYFIIFFTDDKQTGIDYYEILEATPDELLKAARKRNLIIEWLKKILNIEKKFPTWERVKSPHLLKDQSLDSVIIVKAVDNAGNERVVEYENDALERLRYPTENYIMIAAFIILIILLLILLIILTVTEPKGRKEKE